MNTPYTISFTKVLQEKVKDYSDALDDFEMRVYPKLRRVQPADRGEFHRRVLTLLILANDIQKRTLFAAEFNNITFPELRHLILQLDDLNKHVKWVKVNQGTLGWFYSSFAWLDQMGNEALLLARLLNDLHRSEQRKYSRNRIFP